MIENGYLTYLTAQTLIDEDGNYVFFNYDTIQTGTNAAFQVLYKNMDIMEFVDGSTWSLPGYAEVDGERKDMPELTVSISARLKARRARAVILIFDFLFIFAHLFRITLH